jgi:PleD family two-component response regulator
VVVARTGREGLEAALRFSPQLLITSRDLPELDGMSLCRLLRETRMGREIHTLVLTDIEDEERFLRAFDAGIDDYLVRPFSPAILMARIRAAQRLLQMRDERDQDAEQMRSLATELALNNRRLQLAAATDSLTGLPNRR